MSEYEDYNERFNPNIVIQMNKKDLPDARGEDELADLHRTLQPPIIPAVAIRGEGVLETLKVQVARLMAAQGWSE